MNLCRCPHCRATFQLNIPPDSQFWTDAATDDEGLTLWVCLDCHRRGMPAVGSGDVANIGYDTSYRHEAVQHRAR